jgi:uncharacterized protein YjbI with pentapeptide repeats
VGNPKHLDKLGAGVAAWNAWQRENQMRSERVGSRAVRPDLSGVDLGGRQLSGIDLSFSDLRACNFSNSDLTLAQMREADVTGADLQFATLRNANLYGACLGGANLRESKLLLTNFTSAKLPDADLSGAHVSRTVFYRCMLRGANFTGSWISDAVFSGVDLRAVTGLEMANYEGPSSVGIDVLFLSEGKVPLAFLRGTGIPDSLITYADSLTTDPVQFYTCFISYSATDQEFAERLHTDLQAQGVRCWFAPHDMLFGRKVYQQIDEAIRIHEKLLLILSANSMRSEWVKTEISRARQRELKEGVQVLFPISLVSFEELRQWQCFDADTGKDSAREIREYLVADFSQWNDYRLYKRQFAKLMRSLVPDRRVRV